MGNRDRVILLFHLVTVLKLNQSIMSRSVELDSGPQGSGGGKNRAKEEE